MWIYLLGMIFEAFKIKSEKINYFLFDCKKLFYLGVVHILRNTKTEEGFYDLLHFILIFFLLILSILQREGEGKGSKWPFSVLRNL